MEDLAKSWSNMSLSEMEDSGFILPKAQRTNEFIIVAKFLTTWALNMDAVARPFKQVWRCNDGFKI